MTDFETLVAAQSAAPGQPEAYVVENGSPVGVTKERLQKLVDTGYRGPVCAVGSATWGLAEDLGVRPTPPPPPPPPPAAAGAVPPPPPPPIQVQATAMVPAAPAGAGAGAMQTTYRRDVKMPAIDEETARRTLALMAQPVTESLGDIMEAAANEGVASHSFNFVMLKGENWTTPKSTPKEIIDFLPAANRPYVAIYIASRMAATGWRGAGSAGSSAPPVWRFAIPHFRVNPEATTLTRKVIAAGKKVQYTPGALRDKFDEVGRLVPAVHILLWNSRTGFFLLDCPGYKTSELTLVVNKGLEANSVVPVRIEVFEELQQNKRVMGEDPSAKNAQWKEHYVKANCDASMLNSDPRAAAQHQAFQAYFAGNGVEVAGVLSMFLNGTDYAGLAMPEIVNILEAYERL